VYDIKRRKRGILLENEEERKEEPSTNQRLEAHDILPQATKVLFHLVVWEGCEWVQISQ
jgi:hypothetical protein